MANGALGGHPIVLSRNGSHCTHAMIWMIRATRSVDAAAHKGQRETTARGPDHTTLSKWRDVWEGERWT